MFTEKKTLSQIIYQLFCISIKRDIIQGNVSQTFVHVNIQCLDDRYPKLTIYISEFILDS
jgi:hypothetical protein